MTRYIVVLLSAVIFVVACNSTPQPVKELAGQEKPIPPPTPIDSSAKVDSILNLTYNINTYAATLKELALWDSCAANKVDSAVVYLTTMPNWYWFRKKAMAVMDTIHYKNLYTHAKTTFYTYDNVTTYFPREKDDRTIMLVKKPVIYLYPTTTQNITVKLGFTGTGLYTWPKIQANNTWNVSATPDGTLTAGGEEYAYLFWEGAIKNMSINYGEGFVVKADDTETFLTEKLKLLGLNARERTDFITYWAPELRANGCNFIRFETDVYVKSTPLTITPAPESVQRICMVFGKVHESYSIPKQPLKPFTRKGYTVIEWGGFKTVLN